MNGGLPNFLGLGVQKGGTTTLQKLLEQHPGAYLPQAKELHYFSCTTHAVKTGFDNTFLQRVTNNASVRSPPITCFILPFQAGSRLCCRRRA